ncbi:uncharacterized protein LOC129590382 [Paramacrobiotus metropolitanus]|uniref:uncharacterized protein LOC129590382 n=1 Tax=Paramacrobiotus metropolitanus TaxID=2943436 RepID=UPI0024457C7C|nr:uncharacterized protein LOC129590382 [Paramacrobiotus metropolitanus]
MADSGGGGRFANFSVNQRWPNHINIDVFRQTLCQASDGDLFLRCNELQERYSRLNCAIREGKALKLELTRQCSDHIYHLETFEEEIKQLESAVQEKQIKVEENKQTATQYSCEAHLLMNQPPPKLPPPEDTSIAGDLARLSDQIFEMYAALLVLRAGEIVLFEDMKSQIEKRPACTRNVKHQIKELRKKIREYEHTILNLTNEQKKWKGTLKAGKLNICRRARVQHNGLKEEAGRLKRTIELFDEEKAKLGIITRNLEDALNTTLGEQELADLMEHFEPLVDPNNQIHTAGEQAGTNGKNLFKQPKPAASTMSGMRRMSGVAATSVEQAEKVNQLQKMWLDSVATRVKMEGNVMRGNFDIELLEAALTAESYYDNKKPDCERRRMVRTIVAKAVSDELLGFKEADLAEYFDPDVKFPGRNRCMEVH